MNSIQPGSQDDLTSKKYDQLINKLDVIIDHLYSISKKQPSRDAVEPNYIERIKGITQDKEK